MRAVAGLLGLLAQEIFLTARERPEELIVEVIPVGEDDQSWILHRRIGDEPTSIERHGEALSRSLRVPDDAYAAISLGTRGRDRRLDGAADSVELVIARHLLRDSATVVLVNDEVADEVEETALLEDAADGNLQLREQRGRKVLALDCA